LGDRRPAGDTVLRVLADAEPAAALRIDAGPGVRAVARGRLWRRCFRSGAQALPRTAATVRARTAPRADRRRCGLRAAGGSVPVAGVRLAGLDPGADGHGTGRKRAPVERWTAGGRDLHRGAA